MEAVIYSQYCWIHASDLTLFQESIGKLLRLAGFGVLGEYEHHFLPAGYTKIWLLAESHLALHTFPEEDVFYLELSSCIDEKARSFWHYLKSSDLADKLPIRVSKPEVRKPYSTK